MTTLPRVQDAKKLCRNCAFGRLCVIEDWMVISSRESQNGFQQSAEGTLDLPFD